LVISGAKARYQGTGTIDGSDHVFSFQLTAWDGDVSETPLPVDHFRAPPLPSAGYIAPAPATVTLKQFDDARLDFKLTKS
jgi:hypothetical protein